MKAKSKKAIIMSQGIKNKRIITFVAVLGILILSIIISMVLLNHTIDGQDTIASVNGYPIVLDEYKLFLSETKSATFIYFHNKYNAEDTADFWDKSFSGEIPLEKAKSDAFEKVKRAKIEQALMVENKILSDISYKAFQKSLLEENNKRKESIKDSKVIYGLKQYDEYRYYKYLQSNRTEKLKEEMGKGYIKITIKDLLYFYENNKEQRYTLPDILMIKYIKLQNSDNENSIVEINANLTKEIKKGLSFEDIAKMFSNTKVQDLLVNEDQYRSLSKADSNFLQEIMSLKVGQISGIIKGAEGYYIVKCLERKVGGFKAFNDIKELISKEYIDSKYEEILKKTMDEAEVKIVNKVYNKITISNH